MTKLSTNSLAGLSLLAATMLSSTAITPAVAAPMLDSWQPHSFEFVAYSDKYGRADYHQMRAEAFGSFGPSQSRRMGVSIADATVSITSPFTSPKKGVQTIGIENFDSQRGKISHGQIVLLDPGTTEPEEVTQSGDSGQSGGGSGGEGGSGSGEGSSGEGDNLLIVANLPAETGNESTSGTGAEKTEETGSQRVPAPSSILFIILGALGLTSLRKKAKLVF